MNLHGLNLVDTSMKNTASMWTLVFTLLGIVVYHYMAGCFIME